MCLLGVKSETVFRITGGFNEILTSDSVGKKYTTKGIFGNSGKLRKAVAFLGPIGLV